MIQVIREGRKKEEEKIGRAKGDQGVLMDQFGGGETLTSGGVCSLGEKWNGNGNGNQQKTKRSPLQ